MSDSFAVQSTLQVNDKSYTYYSLKKFASHYNIDKLPISLKILLENCLRLEDGETVRKEDIINLASHASSKPKAAEIAFMPARVLLQDFTGVPAIVDLAAMRNAMLDLGGDPNKINPMQPVQLVIDHSVQVDNFGNKDSKDINTKLEHQRNRERYQFLRWGQTAFDNFKVVPPGTGIVHQVNLEYLADVAFSYEKPGVNLLYPDTLVGTDSHTTMINGLGVLGWGVGGIEAEAAMLGQAVSMLIPEVVGFKIIGQMPEGTTATDLVLRVVEILRNKGVVGKFVEFFGDGLSQLPLADRATIANMAPEYGATCGFFPVDNETLRYLRFSGRSAEQVNLVEQYNKAQGMFREDNMLEANYADIITLDLATIEPAISGPKRPQDRINLKDAQTTFVKELAKSKANATPERLNEVTDGSVVIAAITSCTNTSNPYVMLAAGLVAKKATSLGLTVPEWVKTSLAPGSKVVTDYLQKAGLLPFLEKLGFNVVGYGCTTCIGNSGPLVAGVSKKVIEEKLHVCSVLSGNRNFEGRIHADIRMNFLASPPLVVCYALAGTMNIDITNDVIAKGSNGPVYLKDLWPSRQEVEQFVSDNLQAEMFTKSYADVFNGDAQWRELTVPEGEIYAWESGSTYVKQPPYFQNMPAKPAAVTDISDARVLVKLGDSVTTDHISPAGAIKKDSPAGVYLTDNGIQQADFNSYGSRRGNHEVMMRGTFANVRLRNLLAPGTEGGVTIHLPTKQQTSIFAAAEQYRADNIPLIILAGKEYGSGSSRDWAAKGPCLLGVKAVIAESFERIHRSNLVGMGILPLCYKPGDSADSLGLAGDEEFSITDLTEENAKEVNVAAKSSSGEVKIFQVDVRLDTPKERQYYKNGGILHYVLRQLAFTN